MYCTHWLTWRRVMPMHGPNSESRSKLRRMSSGVGSWTASLFDEVATTDGAASFDMHVYE